MSIAERIQRRAEHDHSKLYDRSSCHLQPRFRLQFTRADQQYD